MAEAGWNPWNPRKVFNGSWIPEPLERAHGISAVAKLLYARLARYAGDDCRCHPNLLQLAVDLGFYRPDGAPDKRPIQRTLRELEALLLILAVRPSRQGRGQSTEYHFLHHPIFRDIEQKGDNPPSEPSQLLMPQRPIFGKGDKPSPFTPAGKGDNFARKGDKSEPQSTTPSSSPSETPREPGPLPGALNPPAGHGPGTSPSPSRPARSELDQLAGDLIGLYRAEHLRVVHAVYVEQPGDFGHCRRLARLGRDTATRLVRAWLGAELEAGRYTAREKGRSLRALMSCLPGAAAEVSAVDRPAPRPRTEQDPAELYSETDRDEVLALLPEGLRRAMLSSPGSRNALPCADPGQPVSPVEAVTGAGPPC